MWIQWGVVLALPLLVGGCGDGGGTPDTRGRTVPLLDGTSWIATRITDSGRPRALVAGTELRVDFHEGNVSINAGCNGLSGRYHLSADAQLTTGTLAGTEMGCDQPRMDQDTWLSGTVFAAPLTASVEGDTLTLARTGLELVLTDRSVASPDAALVGTSWQLDGIRSGDTVSSVPAGHTSTLMIGAGGVVTLHTGCNSGRGTATVTGATISFGPVLTTRMACADAAGRRTESAVLAVLDGQVSWTITEKSLTLTKGAQGLTYRAAP